MKSVAALKNSIELPDSIRQTMIAMPIFGATPDEVRRVISGKTVVITGGSRGIGAATAVRLAAVGAHVVLLARTESDLHAVTERVRAGGGCVDFLAVDLRDIDAAAQAGSTIVHRWGPPQVVLSNAGHSIHRYLDEYADRFHDVSRTDAINYQGPVALLLKLLPAMVNNGQGHFISVSTTSVDFPAPGWSVYGASKSAFEAWTRAVAPELLNVGVATTSIHFPLVDTAMNGPGTHPAIPALTTSEAAAVITRAIVRRPRLIRPWWGGLAGGLLDVAPKPADIALAKFMNHDRARRRHQQTTQPRGRQ